MNSGLIGGIIGSALGIAGGLFGAYCSYKRAKGPRERRFVVLTSSLFFFFIALFLALLFLFPQFRAGIFVAYAILLTVGILYLTRRQGAIRREEETNA